MMCTTQQRQMLSMLQAARETVPPPREQGHLIVLTCGIKGNASHFAAEEIAGYMADTVELIEKSRAQEGFCKSVIIPEQRPKWVTLKESDMRCHSLTGRRTR